MQTDQQDIFFTDDQTVGDMKVFMREKVEKGVKCPCCQQYAKVYVRALTSSMAYGLILLHKASLAPGQEFIHIEEYFKKLDIPSSIRGDFPKLRFWGLIETQDISREDKNPNNGLYKITESGRDFVRGRMLVPPKARIYNNRFLGFAKGMNLIDIKMALKNKFNYEELMK